jgi:hypothetical protein
LAFAGDAPVPGWNAVPIEDGVDGPTIESMPSLSSKTFGLGRGAVGREITDMSELDLVLAPMRVASPDVV